MVPICMLHYVEIKIQSVLLLCNECVVSIYLSVAGCVVIVGYLIICPPEPDTHLASPQSNNK